MDKTPLWELWDPAPYMRDPGGVSCTHVLGNKHTELGPSCGRCLAHELAPAPLGHSLGAPREHWVRQSPQMRQTLWKSRSPAKEFQHTVGKNLSEFRHTGGSKRKCFTLPASTPPPRQHSSVPREHFSAHGFSHRGKWEHVSEHLASPVVQDLPKKSYFSLTPPRVLNWVTSCTTRGW